MDDALRVRGAEGREDLAHDEDGARRVERALLDDVTDALAVDVLEHEEERAIGEASEVGRGADAGVLDAAGGDRLPLEARDQLGRRHRLGEQQLQREALPHVDVLGEVHRAHRAFTELLDQAVALTDDLLVLGAARRRRPRGRRVPQR